MIIQENPNLMDLFECHQKCAMFEGGHIYNIYIYKAISYGGFLRHGGHPQIIYFLR